MPGLLGSDDRLPRRPRFCTCTGDFPIGTVTKRPALAADPDQMTGLGDRLYRTAVAGRQRVVAQQLTFLSATPPAPKAATSSYPLPLSKRECFRRPDRIAQLLHDLVIHRWINDVENRIRFTSTFRDGRGSTVTSVIVRANSTIFDTASRTVLRGHRPDRASAASRCRCCRPPPCIR